MKRFIIHDPVTNSYVKIRDRGWTSGHFAEQVNSYGSYEEAIEDTRLFDSLKKCRVVEIEKRVKIMHVHE